MKMFRDGVHQALENNNIYQHTSCVSFTTESHFNHEVHHYNHNWNTKYKREQKGISPPGE